MVDFPGEWNYPDPLRTASRRGVDAHRKGDADALKKAREELARRVDDDHAPQGRLLLGLMERCNRYLSGPPERCAKVAFHRGPCKREGEISHVQFPKDDVD